MSKIIQPVTSFGQYLNTGTIENGQELENEQLVCKYYGSDIAKTLTNFNKIKILATFEEFINILVEFLELKTGSKIIKNNLDNTIFIIDENTEKILYKLPNCQLYDYQYKNNNEYISKYENILIVQSNLENPKILNDPKNCVIF